jgi:hypothetical protein
MSKSLAGQVGFADTAEALEHVLKVTTLTWGYRDKLYLW